MFYKRERRKKRRAVRQVAGRQRREEISSREDKDWERMTVMMCVFIVREKNKSNICSKNGIHLLLTVSK